MLSVIWPEAVSSDDMHLICNQHPPKLLPHEKSNTTAHAPFIYI